MTNAVVIGMIVAARTDAPNSPNANSALDSPPATGARARAASSAVSIEPPVAWIVVAVATTMKIAMTFVQIAPPLHAESYPRYKILSVN
jgi:tetrahydromethanopterin S-methyltransferase subunit E